MKIHFFYTHYCFNRSLDGQLLIISSSDGFCSIISFSKKELGELYTDEVKDEILKTEEFIIENNGEVLNKDILLNIEEEKDKEKEKKQDYSEPITKKRVQLVTLSSPKNKKYLSK